MFYKCVIRVLLVCYKSLEVFHECVISHYKCFIGVAKVCYKFVIGML